MAVVGSVLPRQARIRDLAKLISDGELSIEQMRAMPGQSLYIVILQSGLELCAQILADVTDDQYRVMLDFEFWDKDKFREDKFWHWLAAINEKEDLSPLFQFVKMLDSNLLMLLVNRYLNVVVLDEPTEQPPSAGYYTPDQGYTWISIGIEDQERHNLFARILAYVFESDADRFYQLLAEAQLSTLSELEESAYQEKLLRLSDEGVPDHETSWRINRTLTLNQLKQIAPSSVANSSYDARSFAPLLYDSFDQNRLKLLIQELKDSGREEQLDTLEAEVTLIVNSAIIYFSTDISEINEVRYLAEKVRGAICIGFEMVENELNKSVLEIYQAYFLQPMYQLGLGKLSELKKLAQKQAEITQEQPMQELLSALSQPFPELPAFFNQAGSFSQDDQRLNAGRKAFQSLSEVNAVASLLAVDSATPNTNMRQV